MDIIATVTALGVGSIFLVGGVACFAVTILGISSLKKDLKDNKKWRRRWIRFGIGYGTTVSLVFLLAGLAIFRMMSQY